MKMNFNSMYVIDRLQENLLNYRAEKKHLKAVILSFQNVKN